MHSLLFTLGLATAFAPFAAAHTTFTTLFIDGVNQGDGTCIRMAKKGDVATFPIAGGLGSKDMACGLDGQDAVAFTCPAPSGAKLTLEFRMWADAAKPGAIDDSHVGPMAIYLKKVSEDMKATPAAGGGWFKIWDEGFDAAAKKWATEKLIADNGLLSIDLPTGLPEGYYLARHEIITLQNVTNNVVAPQFYVGCAQLHIAGGSGGNIPSDKTVAIPGHISDATSPSLDFNVYQEDPTTYKVPGPKVFFPTSGSNTKVTTTNDKIAGTVPATCLLKNANWCGTAVPAYTDETGCWASAQNCWDQLDVCYNTAPPTGSRGCKLWEEKMCTVLQNACQSKQFQGPPKTDLKADAEGVNAPVPGKLPGAVNEGVKQVGEGEGNNGAAATATASAAGPEATGGLKKKCGLKKARREEIRRRRVVMALP
ncbi:glycoside hydrolase [Dichotomopilus funicola]|uniref:lytic cellulose monooxygenase (C4-dehydrogenating) n=1 Tax=Dichotomopilus funicola TaxID=1934379 RepID=A0AAN6ZQR2_9PEZI|nr:glycoside hydrolase [Dichotomopilus funicola]